MGADAEIFPRLKAAVGAPGFSEDIGEIAPHLVEWRGLYRGHSTLLLKPHSAAEVSAILAICNETHTPVVPQGGNTGLVGGQIPMDGEVLLSLERMNRIRRIDTDEMAAIAEAGAILSQLQGASDRAGVYFPLSLAAEGSCTIGGNVSTNAGGVNVLRYGTARNLVLGLEVVLANGRVLDLLRTLRKDNTGYDLKQLFIGAEGTLGVITAAALRLFPKPASRETAMVGVRDPQSAIALLNLMQERTGGLVSAFELIPRLGIALVLAHIPRTKEPIEPPSDWYVLAEATGAREMPLADAFEDAIAGAVDRGLARDAAVAANDSQRASLWLLRESLSEAQKREGASIKHDVSVPIGSIPEFLRRASAAVSALVPGVRPLPFGHLGDGNIHFNFSEPKGGDGKAFLARWSEVSRLVHDLVAEFGGSISAEHGLGIMKREEILRYKSAAETDAMRALKRMFDPNNILNPGKVLAANT